MSLINSPLQSPSASSFTETELGDNLEAGVNDNDTRSINHAYRGIAHANLIIIVC